MKKNLSNFEYVKQDETLVSLTNISEIEEYYSKGYKFTRLGLGNMQKTKLVYVDLSQFDLSSENRRIINKYPQLTIKFQPLPLNNYDWKIGKLAKDFYTTKFGEHTFSANKIKELLSKPFNFNYLATFEIDSINVGYCICFKTDNILHYSYPFYILDYDKSSLGIAMMTKTIIEAKKMGLQRVYLGGYTSDRDKYKLQFKGVNIIE